ncbi:structural maintenance of chromosomes protein 5 [Biomphalaria glabrata]|nr:structural maintenance of chromosomes protein 5-like [Biomphalaria glabrata]
MSIKHPKKRQSEELDYFSRDAGSTRTKSRSVVKHDSVYSEGSIVRIKLVSFLTYDNVEFNTGPYLNILIGPNGTGKSAIVCAICLGLAGKTNWLGRASDPKDFIKYGAEKAVIEIELFNPYNDSNYIICREIFKSKASNWLINRRTTNQKAVEQLVAKLNIQISNLCQFLPQEKVADFARMSQQELLENTEKAIGKDELYETHQKLKDARQKAKSFEQDVDKYQQELDREKQKNARLEEDVKCYHDRKNFLKKVDILKMKKPWLEYQYLKDVFERGKAEKDKKAEELKEAKKYLHPLEKKCASLKAELENLRRETADLSQKLRSKTKNVTDQRQNINVVTEKIQETRNDFDAKLKEEETRKQKLHDLQEQLKALENALAEIKESDTHTLTKSFEKVTEETRNVSLDINSVQADGEVLRQDIAALRQEKKGYEHQLQNIKNINNRRLEMLRGLHQDTYEAVQWLRSNSSLFKHTIYEPMIISLNVNKPEDVKLVENHISFKDLKAFVCEDPDDLSLFLKQMSTLKLRVNAVKAPPKSSKNFQPKYPISHYQKYGFVAYIQSLFTCPEPVMNYLCLMYNVHVIPVGSIVVKKQLQQIHSECPELTTFYSPDDQFTIKRSRYNNSVSSKNTALKLPKALADSLNVEKEHELHKLMKEVGDKLMAKEEEYKLLQKKSEQLELKINALREEKRNLLKQRDHRKNIESQITTKNQRIQQVMKEELNVNAEKKKLKLLLNSFIKEKIKCLETMKKLVLEYLTMAKERTTKILKLAKLDTDFIHNDTKLQNEKQRFEALAREVKEFQEQAEEWKQQAREKLIEAKKRADIGLNDNLETVLTARGVWEDFKNAPSKIDELDSEIHSMQARAESMFQIDERVVREFEKREEEIRKLEELIGQTESRRQTHQEDITESKRKWLEPLQRLIEQINNKFSHFFSCLQCCGEVSLNIPENSEDYEKYGVCIKVKFRDEESLRELTAYHQSGGERSVSTVLYMLALQELTKCPFRCVDEINQGMDPNNERKIFTLVVQTVCKACASQYFLLTPKLLPDLDYDKHITVLCVYNGPELLDYKQWSLKKFIERRERLELVE